jgi:hypothetical protein
MSSRRVFSRDSSASGSRSRDSRVDNFTDSTPNRLSLSSRFNLLDLFALVLAIVIRRIAIKVSVGGVFQSTTALARFLTGVFIMAALPLLFLRVSHPACVI